MGKVFFTGWALWEKMVFVLACAIVVTVFLGVLKLWYTHWRVRKYTAIEKLVDKVNVVREKSIIRSLSTRRKDAPKRQTSSRYRPRDDTGSDVPFGIKALESGVEVEGVWDSRPNSRRSSFAHVPKQNSVVDLGLVEAGLQTDESKGSLGASTIASGQYDRTVLSEKSDGNAVGSEYQAENLSRGRYPPHSYARYEGIRGHRTTNTFSALSTDSQQSSGYARSQRTISNGSSSSPKTRPSSSETSPTADQLLHPSLRFSRSSNRRLRHPAERSDSADSLDAMQYRRASQVAESGQFMRRTRDARRGSDASSATHDSFDIADTTLQDASTVEGGDLGLLRTPRIQVIGCSPPSEPPNFAPYDADAEYMRRQHTIGRPRVGSEPDLTPAKDMSGVPRSSFSVSDRRSQRYYREVNAGFAVRRPGSEVVAPSSAVVSGDNSQDVSSSALYSSEEEGNQKRHSKKLQKKRRPSQDSQRSSRTSFEVRRNGV